MLELNDTRIMVPSLVRALLGGSCFGSCRRWGSGGVETDVCVGGILDDGLWVGERISWKRRGARAGSVCCAKSGGGASPARDRVWGAAASSEMEFQSLKIVSREGKKKS